MGVFVYEVDGLRIAAYGDIDRSRAEAWAEEEGFESDLIRREHNGRPLWDEDSDVRVLEAAPSEIEKWKESRDRARKDGSIDRHDEEWLAFLVQTTRSADEDE